MVSQVGLNNIYGDNYANYLTNQTIAQTDSPAIGNELNFMGGNTLTQDTVDFTAQNTENSGEITNCLLARDKSIAQTENGNYYKTTKTGKVLGTILGLISPVAYKAIEGLKNGSFKDLFKVKSLAIACPALALAGWATGALIDSCANTKRAQNADEKNSNS
jgi:hypothetical protein